MKLRQLEPKDAALMYEWMHDTSVVGDLKANFTEKTMDDCLNFIAAAQSSETDIHFAVADDQDEYMGTVSLKHVDRVNRMAEFAIVVRKAAMGRGFSREAMEQILRYGVEQLDLEHIFWCVSRMNTRAVRFYDKNGYCRMKAAPAELAAFYEDEKELLWYGYPAQG